MQLRLATSPRFVHADARETDLAPRDAALLAWLALEGPTPRTRLARLLWPRSAPDVAGNALRQRLFQLKRQLGVELVSGHTTLSLADGLAHDLGDSRQVLGDCRRRARPRARRLAGAAARAPRPARAGDARGQRRCSRARRRPRCRVGARARASGARATVRSRAPARHPPALPAGRPRRGAARLRPLRAAAEGRGRREAVGRDAGAAGDDQRRRDARSAPPPATPPAGERAAAAAPGRPRRSLARACTMPGTRAAAPSSPAKAAWARAGWSATSRARAAEPSSSARVPATSASSTPRWRASCARCRAAPCTRSPRPCAQRSRAAARARRAGGVARDERGARPLLQCGERGARGRGAGDRGLRLRRPALRRRGQHRAAAVRDRRVDAGAGSLTARDAEVSAPGRLLLDEALAPARSGRGAARAARPSPTSAEIVDSLGIASLRGRHDRGDAAAPLRRQSAVPARDAEGLARARRCRPGAGGSGGGDRCCRRGCRSRAPCTR